MKTFLSFVLFVVSASSFAQTAIKLNAHFQYQSYDNSYSVNDTVSRTRTEFDLSILPGATYSAYKENGNFHEFGLSRLYFGIDDDYESINRPSISYAILGTKTTIFKIGFRYDYNFALSKNKKAIKLYLGVSSSLGYASEINEPKITSSFKSNENKLALNLGIVPRIVWDLSETIFLDLNIPINVFQLEYIHQRIHNPSLALEQQKNSNTEATFFPLNYEVRLGIGIFLFSS